MKEFHVELQKYFPADELETIEGFVGVLLKNDDAALQKHYNGFKEKLFYVKDRESKEIIGGSNFSMILGKNKDLGYATAHLIYTFVSPQFRKKTSPDNLRH